MTSLNSEGLARPEMAWDGLKLHVEEWPRDEREHVISAKSRCVQHG